MVKCKICRNDIVEEELRHIYYDPDYPTIDIGPYCSSCMSTIRICNGCHEPHQNEVSIKYFRGGKFFCTTCAASLEMCSICGGETSIYKIVDGKKYCRGCHDKVFKTCDCCQELKLRDTFITDKKVMAEYPGLFKKYNNCCDGCFKKIKKRFLKVSVKLCQNCRSYFRHKHSDNDDYCPRCMSSLPSCSLCHKKHHNIRSIMCDSSVDASGRALACDKCFNKLEKCGCCNRLSTDIQRSRGLFQDISKCRSCVTKNVHQCSSCLNLADTSGDECGACKALYGDDNKCTCGRVKDGNGKCRICDTTQIYGYSNKPTPKFGYDKMDIGDKGAIFFGIENEITFSSGSACDAGLKSVYSKYGPDFLIAKSDASISGSGFEIVTQPMTLAFFKSTNISGLFPAKMVESSSCGMHVHVNRAAFHSDLHLFKVCQFIHNNRKFIDGISERTMNHYSGDFESKVSRAIKESKQGNGYRNLRVNLTNSRTVEFRMFAGATTEEQMRRRVEFLHALINWTKGVSLKESSVSSFEAYVNKNKKLYPNLVPYLVTLSE